MAVNPGNPLHEQPNKDSVKRDTEKKNPAHERRKKLQLKAKQANPDHPTVASEDSSDNILDTLKKVDPKQVTAFLPNAVDALKKMQKIISAANALGAQAPGMRQTAGNAMGQALKILGCKVDVEKLVDLILVAIKAYKGTFTEEQYEILAQGLSILIESIIVNDGECPPTDYTTTLTPDEKILYDAILYVVAQLEDDIKNGTITVERILQLISLLLSFINNAAKQELYGPTGGNDMGALLAMLPNLGDRVQQTLSNHLPPSVLDQTKVTEALKKYAQNMVPLKKQDGLLDLARQALKSGQAQQMEQMISQLTALIGQTPMNAKVAAMAPKLTEILTLIKAKGV